MASKTISVGGSVRTEDGKTTQRGSLYTGPDGKGRRRGSVQKRKDDGEIIAYSNMMKAYLGNSTTINSYKEVMWAKSGYYEELKRKNLYAIVMPGGHGKTSLAKKYGLIDVDELIGYDTAVDLNEMRTKYVYTSTCEWVAHNEKWYAYCNAALDMMTFKDRTIILCHSEEAACEMGAEILAVLVLDEDVFEHNIRNRGSMGRAFSRISREYVLRRSLREPVIVASNPDMEAYVTRYANDARVPIPAPYSLVEMERSIFYHYDTPRWLLEGRVKGRLNELDNVIKMYECGRIPKQCVDHFVKNECPNGTAYGFGWNANDWARMFGKILGVIGSAKKLDLKEDLYKVFPPKSAAERHRVNVTLRRMISEFKLEEDEDVVDMLSRHVGEKHTYVAGLVSHYLALGKHLPMAEHILPLYLMKYERYSEVMSEFHNMIRLSRTYCDMQLKEKDRQALMYMNMLTGREMYQADWKKVLGERESVQSKDLFISYDSKKDQWTRRQYLSDFEEALNSAYSKLKIKPQPVNVGNFVDFWKRRREWVAKGSTVLSTLPKEMLKYIVLFYDEVVKTIELRHNKKSLFENHEILNILKETVETWNATKVVPKLNETGKKRELLPGTLAHYIIFSYVLFVAEKQGQVGSTRLNAPSDDRMEYYDRKMVKGLHKLLYDWANFNAQHTAHDMQRVIEKLCEIPATPTDYAFFCRAIAESFHHMYLIDDKGGRHKLEKGLYSGWRGTTWINTVLNYIYVYIGVLSTERIYGPLSAAYLDHGGDDLEIAFYMPLDCYKLLATMNKIGYEAAPIKQMIDTRSEFFRNTINQEGVFASPTRALANFVSGNWESMGARTVSEKVVSILDQVGKLTRRGCNPEFCRRIAKVVMKHWLKIKCDDEWFELKPEIIHGRIEDGGLGVPDDDGCVWVLNKKLHNLKTLNLDVKIPGSYCSDDYVKAIAEDFVGSGIKIINQEELGYKMAKDSYDVETLQERAVLAELNKTDVEQEYRELVCDFMWDERLANDFFAWGVENKPTTNLGGIENKKELIGHLAIDGRVLSLDDLLFIYGFGNVKKEVLEFRGNPYYRRLVPEFLASAIDSWVRARATPRNLDLEEMQGWFCTLCSMCAVIYEHAC